MGIKLLVACEDEGQALALGRSFTRERSDGVAGHVADMARLPAAIHSARPDVLVLDHGLCRDQPPHRVLPAVRRLSPTTRTRLLCEACSPDLA